MAQITGRVLYGLSIRGFGYSRLKIWYQILVVGFFPPFIRVFYFVFRLNQTIIWFKRCSSPSLFLLRYLRDIRKTSPPQISRDDCMFELWHLKNLKWLIIGLTYTEPLWPDRLFSNSRKIGTPTFWTNSLCGERLYLSYLFSMR